MSDGVAAIAAIGGHIARVTISPRMNIDYHTGSHCIPGFTLAGAMLDADVKKAMDNPAINVFILTAYDGVTFGDCSTHTYLNPRYYTPTGQAEVAHEYSDLTLYLYRTYQKTSKRFIISNWESDNDVYCGQAYGYATDPQFRANCDTSYPLIYSGNSSPAESLQGLKLWFQAREQGIEDGRARAAALGIGGMRVYFAPEISVVRCLHDAGFQSVLYDVVPSVKFDYLSYSSHQSTNLPSPMSSLMQDLATIQSVVGSGEIIIGEIMTDSTEGDSDLFLLNLAQVIDAALHWGAPFVIYWNVHSASDNPGGLYDGSGQLTEVGRFFELYLVGRGCLAPNPHPRTLNQRGQ